MAEKAPDDLEREDKASDTKKEEKSGNHGSAEEKKVYDPLCVILFAIFFIVTLSLYRRYARSAT